ncbi:sigma-70 family RNA polymerase sigma factor [uncultured Alsobacter sp.]|uniref:RNA polymerase sigma factor n=1 Tax=uncultured Alsobacter sp. TaxID=1748258 RepID=UPI0025D60F80|nr:sigma-70 family RNA polymerase sigma factor [uncultured Alsobacter sp.]
MTSGAADAAYDDDTLIARLLERDERAFRWLVRQLHGMMLAFARSFVRDAALAEEVVQETWVAVIDGLARFERRSTLKTWIYSILANKARTAAQRARRTVAFSDLGPAGGDPVDPDRFMANGHWASPIEPWDAMTPERIVAGQHLWTVARGAIELLPEAQRAVLILRDVEEQDGPTVASLLGISEGNQRVLLHRARASVRDALSKIMTDPQKAGPDKKTTQTGQGPRRQS